MDTTLVLVGVACIIGAIVGGGVKLVQVELSPVASLWRQLMLGGFGAVLVVSGLIAGGRISLGSTDDVEPRGIATGVPDPVETPNPPPEPSPSPSVTPTAAPVETPASRETPAMPDPEPEPSPDPVRAALPGRVDIFWCDGGDGDANALMGGRIAPALRAAGAVVRVRSLAQATNAGSSYRIFRRIVRFDPGERPAAREVARLASEAGGATFRAEPALPGSPSIDYLSVFVCSEADTQG